MDVFDDIPYGERVFFAQSLVDYHELDQPQDACAAGRVQAFGKTNEPAVTVSGAPFVTGLSPTGRLVQAAGAKPAFYGTPLVAWKPALGADEYQIQWSPTRYPWRPVDAVTVLQAQIPRANRWITEARLTTSSGEDRLVELTGDSRVNEGQRIEVPRATITKARLDAEVPWARRGSM